LLNWRLTSKDGSPAGPNFQSERERSLVGPGQPRARRPSILEEDMAPSEYIAAQQADGAGFNGPGGPPTSRSRARTNSSAHHSDNGNGINVSAAATNGSSALVGLEDMSEQRSRAVEVLDRVNQKLTGRDFKPHEELDVVRQVDKLIDEAVKLENLCQHYIGWCSFW
jgi:serine/threonine-protein kinase mTOR